MNWEVIIVDRFERKSKFVYVMREIGEGKTEVMGFDGTVSTIDMGQDPQPFIKIPDFIFRHLITEGNKLGIKAPNEHVLEGKLEATIDHLVDMRKIAFKALHIDEKKEDV